MRGVHAPAGRDLPVTPGGGWTRAAGAVRLLVSVLLLGSALLILAMVGQGLAAEGEAGTAPSPALSAVLPPAPQPLTVPRPGRAAGEDPTAAYLRALAETGDLLNPLAGPVQPAVRSTGAPPRQPDRLPSAPSGLDYDWGHGLARRLELARAVVAGGGGDDDDGDGGGRGQLPPGRVAAAGTLPRDGGILAQSSGTPAPLSLCGSVCDVVMSVVKAADDLSKQATPLGGPAARGLPGEVETIKNDATRAHKLEFQADRARANGLEFQQPLRESHAAMDAVVEGFAKFIEHTDAVGEKLQESKSTLYQAADKAAVNAERGRAASQDARSKPQQASSSAAVWTISVSTDAAFLMKELKNLALRYVDLEMQDWVENADKHQKSADKLQKRPGAAEEVAEAAVAELDVTTLYLEKLIQRTREVADRLWDDGQTIRAAARAAVVDLADAKARAEQLRQGDEGRTAPADKRDSLLGDPDATSDGTLDGTAGRQADGGGPDPAARAPAAVEQAPPAAEGSGTPLEGWAGTDPATTEPAAEPAAPAPTLDDGPSRLAGDAGPGVVPAADAAV
ncbi:MAG TPA: hypothetical protein VKG45_09525 [Actinomycetes bacterium]|nr:hypothetical protein [Actinomycetes bacterium]